MDLLEQFDEEEFNTVDTSSIPIYTSLVAKMTLTDEDRESLKKKRGFGDQLIDTLQFKSCIPSNVNLIEALKQEFSESDLIKAGILEATEKGIIPCQQLLGDYNGNSNILIPYMNEDQQIFYIRPHKFGLSGKGINLYIPYRKVKDIDTWIIAESEFKAAATLQLGFPAIGVPGIHSFAKRHFIRLGDVLEHISNLNRIVIIFDNEIKNDPKLPNYKPDVRKQWDTQWRSCHMARLIKDRFPSLEVKIGELPAAWMDQGKIDIDGALAKGITREQFKAVVYSARDYSEYLGSLPDIAKKIIHKKVNREFYKTDILRKDNTYYVKDKQTGGNGKPDIPIWKRISNFTITVEKVLVDETGYHREVVFHGADGSTHRAICPPENISLREFKRWANSCGNYVFTGEQRHLDLLYELEYTNCDSREIRRPQEIGELKKLEGEEQNVWLFGNCLLKGNTSEILTSDETGVIWDGLVGYQPASIQEADTSDFSAKMPVLNLGDTKFGMAELKQVTEDLISIYENPSIKLAVGWIVACLFSREIFNKFSCFPLLFVCGKRGSGKTTLVNYLMALAGFSESAGDALGASSEAGVLRCLAWYNSLPYWLDEYRNNPKIRAKWEGFLRNTYNRQATSKGTRGSKIRAHQINAGIILSGEETPEDNALFSRCVIISLSDVRARKEKKPHLYNKLQDLRQLGLLSRLSLEVIKRRKSFTGLLEFIESMKERLIKSGVSERIAINYAIPATCYYAAFLDSDSEEVAKNFIKEVAEMSFKIEKQTESEHMLNVFWEDIVTLQEDLKDFYCIYEVPGATKGKKRIALHFKTFYNKWAESYHRKGSDQFKHGTMLSYIKEEKYYIEDQRGKKIGPNKKTTRCLILSLDEQDDPPAALTTLSDQISPSSDADTDPTPKDDGSSIAKPEPELPF